MFMNQTLRNFVPRNEINCNGGPIKPPKYSTIMDVKYYKLEQRDNFNMKETRTVYKLLARSLSSEEFVKMVAHRHGFSETTISGVLRDVSLELALMLAEGHNVSVPGIGVFSLGVRLKQERREQLEDEQSAAEDAQKEGASVPKVSEPNAKQIALHHINCRIDKGLFRETEMQFRHQTLKRIGGKQGVRISIDDKKPSERLAAAKAYLEEHHFMHVSDYADITGLTYSSAQRELRELDKFEYSGIKAKGSGSHRVYVLSPKAE